MDFLSNRIGFAKILLAFFVNRQQVQHDTQQQQIGEQTQIVSDQNAAIVMQKEMGQALADQPISKEDFDSQLSQGKF